MNDLKTLVDSFNEGLITDREFLGQVIHIVGVKWQQLSESSNDDAFCAQLAKLLSQ